MKYTAFFPLLILLLYAGCNGKIDTTYEHGIDFSKYKTFCWMKGCEFTYTGPAYLSDTSVRGYFKRAITDEMGKRGIVYNADYPDLLVDVHITIENKTQVIFHRYEEPHLSFLPLAEPSIEEYLKGTLVVDMADRSAGKMVWRSVASGYMDVHPEISEKNVRKGMHKLMKRFPPVSPSSP